MKKQVAILSLLLPILLIVMSSDVLASEGEITLRSQDGTNAECKALSVFMPSLRYNILMTCRQISYPGDVDQFNYVAWAQPSDGGSPQLLGTLGVGKVEFDTNKPFNRIFVTRETNSRPRNPSDKTVMGGNVESIRFNTTSDPQPETQQPQITPSPVPEPQENRSIISRLVSPGRIIAFVGVIILLILVFILTRR